jgi:methionine synthase I (cobalamin-dependent)
MPDAWNLLHPDRVEAVARAYVEAGSRIILTNT